MCMSGLAETLPETLSFHGRRTEPWELTGRDRDIAVIRDLVLGLVPRGHALLLEGEPGVGKSTLLDVAEEIARGAGIQVLRAAGAESETACFSTLNQLLLPLHADLSRLDGLQQGALKAALGFAAGPRLDRLVVADAALALLRQAAAKRPLLVIVDDLQWVDAASALVLKFAARRLRGTQLRIIAAEQGGPSRPRALDVPGCHVRPLDDDAAARLAGGRFPGLARAVRQRIVAEARGNPVALLELLSGLTDRQRLGLAPLPAVLPVSERLRDLLSARVSALPPTAAKLLLLAVLEGTGDLRLLHAAAAGQCEPGDLALAQRVGLVHVDESVERVTFPHPAVASAVLERSARDEIRQAHRALAAVLRDQPARSAWHLAGAATADPVLPAPRQPLDRGDAGQARQLATAALLAGRVLGDLGAAETLLSDALCASPAGEPPAEITLATAFVRLHADGDMAAGRALGPGTPLGRLEREIESLAGQSGPAELVRTADRGAWTGQLPACRGELRRVARSGPDGDVGLTTLQAGILLSLEAYQTGQWDEAGQLAQTAATRCAERGYQLLHLQAQTVLAFVAAGRGDAGTARIIGDDIVRWAAPRGITSLLAGARYAGVLAALAQSDFHSAHYHAVRISPPGQISAHLPWAAWAFLDLVEAALRTDRSGDAIAHVAAAREAGLEAASPRMALLSTVAMALTAPDNEAPALFDRALATEDAERWPFDLARVHLLAGERLRRMRSVTAARDHLRAALDEFRRLGAPTWAERAATARRATGEPPPPADRLDVPLLTPQELGIAQLAAAGLSNKEIAGRLFISHRTVASHLFRIFPKLGITSRAALGRALPREGG
jgi:DNA-binding CsgD family transcriptional regulator